jgi:uncharacterized membrane protein
MSRSFSGPLPPPEALARYNDVVPGAAGRIIAMAEKQQEHRQELEQRVVFSNAETQKHGLHLGFVIAMTAILGGIWLISIGKETTGLVAIVTAIASLVGVFVYGKSEQKKELEKKSQAMVKS